MVTPKTQNVEASKSSKPVGFDPTCMFHMLLFYTIHEQYALSLPPNISIGYIYIYI